MSFGHRQARRRGMVVGAAVTSSRARKQAAASPAEPAVVQATSQSATTEDTVSQLKQFAELRDQGVLTEEEFNAKKKQILGL